MDLTRARNAEIQEFWNSLHKEVDDNEETLMTTGDLSGRVGNNPEETNVYIGKFCEKLKKE